MRRLAVAALAAVCFAPAATGQAVTAIRAGRLVDVERGEVRRDQLILVRGDRIEGIRPGGTRSPPAPD